MMRNDNTTQIILKQAVRWTVAIAAGAASTVAAAAADATGAAKANAALNAVSFTAAPTGPAAQPAGALVETGVDASGRIELSINKTAVITTKEKIKRQSVGQPDIADVTVVGPSTLLVTGKKFGSTQIIVWNEKEESQVIDVNVSFDVQAIRDEFKRAFPDAPIEISVLNGQVTLKGRVPNLKTAEQAQRVAEAYTKDVINFLEVGGGQQIVLAVQFIEMNRAASNQLGFNAFFNDGQSTFGINNGPAADARSNSAVSPITLFGSGTIGSTAFEVFLSALKSNALARTLAEPNLVAISGEDAEFLAGGEIPIPVPQAGAGGSSTITIEYKEFGVRLKYNAVVLGDGRIRMKVQPEVSELDYNNSTSINGQPIPGLRTRKVNSIVEMNEGQTLALAGLLQRRVDTRNTGTPGLMDLPIIGAMFRNVSYSRSETELVILVTPRLAQGMNPDQLPAAVGTNWRYPNEARLFGLNDMGGPAATDKGEALDTKLPAPRYVGPTGFGEPNQPVQPAVASVDTK